MKSEIFCKVGRALGKTKLYLHAKSPEILIGVAIASGIGCVVAAVVETHRYADDILDSHKEAISKVKETKEKYPDEYSKKDAAVDTVIAWAKTTKEVVRVYWPTMALGALSVVSVLGSYKIINGRYTTALAASTALKEAFEKYRKRVVEEYGEEMDRHFMYGTKKKTFEEKDKDGNDVVTVAEVPEDTDMFLTDTQFFFGKGYATEWEFDQSYDISFLYLKESRFNDLLRSRGYVLLNDVLYELGIKQTSAGAHLGWVWGYPGADDCIDFGIQEMQTENHVPLYALNFNCHGDVDFLIDKINENRERRRKRLSPSCA